MDKKHEVVSDLKRVADLLGHQPTRREYLENTTLGRKYESAFGLYTEALKAAFGEPPPKQENSTKKLINDFFARDIRDLIRDTPLQLTHTSIPCKEITIAIGDAHFPFSCAGSIMLIYALIEQVYAYCVAHGITLNIIQEGDLFDMWSFGRFARSHCYIRPDEEIRLGMQMSKEFWATIRRLAPKAKLVQIRGNHDIRPMRKLLASNAPELEVFFKFDPIFMFDGVTTHLDTRENVFIDSIQHTHGHLKSGTHRAKLGTHVAHGHTHKGGMYYSKVNGVWLYELDVGYVGDPKSPALGYTEKKSDSQHWHKGVGLITPWGMQFIPFEEP